jgi:hypothetical protein
MDPVGTRLRLRAGAVWLGPFELEERGQAFKFAPKMGGRKPALPTPPPVEIFDFSYLRLDTAYRTLAPPPVSS